MKKKIEIKVDERLKLELVSEERAKESLGIINENREYLKVWLPWLDFITKLDDQINFIKRQIKLYNGGRALVLFLLYEDKIIGTCGFNEIKNNIGSVGCWICEEYAGKGIMFKAITKLITYGFNEFGIKTMDYRCAVENTCSNKLAKKLGFKYIEIKEKAENLYGKWIDHNVYLMEKEI